MHLNIYLNTGLKKNKFITKVENLFSIPTGSIGHLFSNGDYLFRYQRNLFDKKFNPKNYSCYQEIWLIAPDELLLRAEIYNELIFAKKIHQLTSQEILINDGSDDPYEMILFDRQGIFRIQEDGTYEGPGIKIIPSTKRRLSYKKVLQLFPSKEDLLCGKQSENIPSKLLKNCIIE